MAASAARGADISVPRPARSEIIAAAAVRRKTARPAVLARARMTNASPPRPVWPAPRCYYSQSPNSTYCERLISLPEARLALNQGLGSLRAQ